MGSRSTALTGGRKIEGFEGAHNAKGCKGMAHSPRTEGELIEVMTRPTPAVRDAVSRYAGDVIILGAGGKMGPTLAELLVRAGAAAGGRRVVAVARFSDERARARLDGLGVATIRADLLEDRALASLPEAAHVFLLAGFKFGASGDPCATWAVNGLLPARAVERYRRADEFVEAVLKLWDSWNDGALQFDRAGHYADPDQVKPIHHQGEYFLVDGPLNVPRPPQGHPVLFQAGASDQGRELAARRAEAIYAVAYDLPAAQAYYRDIKHRVKAAGRRAPVPIMPGLVTYVAATVEEAKAKQRELDELLPVEASLRQLGIFIAQDCSHWKLDAPVPPLPPPDAFTGPQGRYRTILRIIKTEKPTVRQLLGRLAAGGGHCTMVGTPEQIADQMANWLFNKGADGFNLMPPSLPSGIEDFVEQVVPVLQRRGLFRTDYHSETLRGHLGLDRPASSRDM